MSHFFTFIPRDDDHVPAGHMNGRIPVLILDGVYGHIKLQFQSDEPDTAITYLTTLVAEASALLEAVKAQPCGDGS